MHDMKNQDMEVINPWVKGFTYYFHLLQARVYQSSQSELFVW